MMQEKLNDLRNANREAAVRSKPYSTVVSVEEIHYVQHDEKLTVG